MKGVTEKWRKVKKIGKKLVNIIEDIDKGIDIEELAKESSIEEKEDAKDE